MRTSFVCTLIVAALAFPAAALAKGPDSASIGEGGWYVAPARLERTLVAVGLPGGSATHVWRWLGVGALALAALAAVAVLVLRRRPQTTPAPAP